MNVHLRAIDPKRYDEKKTSTINKTPYQIAFSIIEWNYIRMKMIGSHLRQKTITGVFNGHVSFRVIKLKYGKYN